METKSSDKSCCCIGGFCRKLTSESDCISSGGKVVASCSDCK